MTLEHGRGSVRSILKLSAVPGRALELAELIESLGVLDVHAAAQAGFGGGEVLVDDGGDLVVVSAAWQSTGAYRGWLENPVRERLVEELSPLLDRAPQGTVLRLAHHVPGNGLTI